MPAPVEPRLRVAVDIGGTFTDLVGFEEAMDGYHDRSEREHAKVDNWELGRVRQQHSDFVPGSNPVITERRGALARPNPQLGICDPFRAEDVRNLVFLPDTVMGRLLAAADSPRVAPVSTGLLGSWSPPR